MSERSVMNIETLRQQSETQLKHVLRIASASRQMLVLTHGNPDPDAIASAFALKYLVKAKTGCRVRVAYPGVIGRMENRTMVKLLRLQMIRLDEIDWRNYDCIALVDHQPRRRMYPWPKDRWPDIIIDHHTRRPLER
ncbi:DHH family phosphoesterase, partial [bacterium]|nr:DHH family phosphoesterase [candidate division CSSED10-310 bacterium]